MSDNIFTYIVDPDDGLVFLRDVFKTKLPASRSLRAKLKAQHKITVNGCFAKTDYRLKAGDLISVDLSLDEENQIIPQDIPLDIVYEDPDLLVINKPAGLAVHPGKDKLVGTLANGVTYYWAQQGQFMRFRPIHRLDKGTSGLIIIGKSQFAHQAMFRQQKRGMIHRFYQAVVEGVIPEDEGCIDLPIAHTDITLPQRRVAAEGKPAVTNFRVIKRFKAFTLLSLTLGTGRTHQIRVHLSQSGYPICGDTLYGSPSPFIERQALHAGHLSFFQPRTGVPLQLEAPLPSDIAKLLERIQSDISADFKQTK